MSDEEMKGERGAASKRQEARQIRREEITHEESMVRLVARAGV